MREIKFRGKYKNTWYYGPFVKMIDWGESYDIYQEETQSFCLVEKETIGQYTGLKDKNGVEIYEGDIVRTKYHELRDFGDEIADDYTELVEEVMWLPLNNGFGLKIMIEDIPLYRPLDFVTEINGIKLIELEVIGNIYDNPELLEVEE